MIWGGRAKVGKKFYCPPRLGKKLNTNSLAEPPPAQIINGLSLSKNFTCFPSLTYNHHKSFQDLRKKFMPSLVGY